VIIENSIKCNACGDEIVSRHRHDFKWCRCGAVAVDGGKDYLRRVGDINNYTDLSIVTEGDYNSSISGTSIVSEEGDDNGV